MPAHKKPTEIKIAEGNPGKTKLTPEDEARSPLVLKLPKPPSIIPCVEGKKYFTKVGLSMIEMGMLRENDIETLTMLAYAYGNYVKLTKYLAKHGLSYTTDKGYEVVRPEVAERKAMFAQWSKLKQDFGLSPTDRTRISKKREADFDGKGRNSKKTNTNPITTDFMLGLKDRFN